MKTRQEIEQLANEEYKDNLHNPFFTAAPMGYIKGYQQCQEDVDWELLVKLSKRYTEEDIIKAIAYGQTTKQIDYHKDFINSLNKQD